MRRAAGPVRPSTSATATPPSSPRCSPASPRPCSRSSPRRCGGSARRALANPVLVGVRRRGVRRAGRVRASRSRSSSPSRRWPAGRCTGWRPGLIAGAAGHGDADDGPPPLIPDDALHHDRPVRAPRRHDPRRRAGRLGRSRSPWSPLLTGAGSVFTQQGLFFSGTAVVTFGGAYAVLAYVAQRAVEDYGWLSRRRHGPRPRPGRDHPRPADHGRAVRRVPRRLPPPRRPRPVGRRRRSPRC